MTCTAPITCYIKRNVSFKEFAMHDYIYNLSLLSNGILNVPQIYDYNSETQTLTMQNINNMCVSDFYGETVNNISADLFDQIREVIRYLYNNHIIYPDITGYNFIEANVDNNDRKLWIIDFEHSDFQTHIKNTFVEEVVNNDDFYSWNPLFA